jgi:hypothetical protein
MFSLHGKKAEPTLADKDVQAELNKLLSYLKVLHTSSRLLASVLELTVAFATEHESRDAREQPE